MLLKDEDKASYDKIKRQILENLSFTMANWKCLDKDMVDMIVEEHMSKLEEDDGFLFYDGERIKDIHMFVAHIKRAINSRI